MDDVVSKPFRIAELLPKIDELARRYPNGFSDASSRDITPSQSAPTSR
jgi:DNA-binding response OmpR family regulator